MPNYSHAWLVVQALVDHLGRRLAILRNPEVYPNRKEELIARTFGIIDPEHPYIQLIQSSGEWLIGGEIELLERIVYHDGAFEDNP